MSGHTAAATNDDVLDVTTHVEPLSDEDRDLRDRQLAVIVRMLQRAAETRESEGTPEH